jgi:hypothetical protein
MGSVPDDWTCVLGKFAIELTARRFGCGEAIMSWPIQKGNHGNYRFAPG